MRFNKIAGGRLALLLFVLAVAAMVWSPGLNAGGPVTRPFTISGQLTFLDLVGGAPFTLIDQGVASETGKFVNVGKYAADFTGFGIYYAASGDQLFWKDMADGFITITGGTGRFEGATGRFSFVVLSSEYVPGPEGTTSWVITYKGQGTITY